MDTGIPNVIVTGDFNLNTLQDANRRKITNICQQNDLHQIITEPTHFTETSATLIDLLFTNKPDKVVMSGVGDPFLDQTVRYHCPIYAILDFQKPRFNSFPRKIYLYEQGDYNMLRQMANDTDWNNTINNDINIYADNITQKIIQLTDSCIPNKVVRIRPNDPPWMNTNIRKNIRKRKRSLKKAKTNKITPEQLV